MAEDQEQFEMLHACVPEIISYLDNKKGLEYLEIFATFSKEIQLLQIDHQEEVKDDFQVLANSGESIVAEKQAIEEKLTSVMRQEQELEKQITTLDQTNRAQEDECTQMKDKLKELKKTKEELLLEKERLDNETTILVPKKREELSLYGNISKIRWDPDSSNVKGYVSSKTEVKPFDFDPNKCSKYFITNSLWDMVPTEW